MFLDNLLKDVKVEKMCSNVDVKDIKIDSREVEKGDVFIALRGSEKNGNDYAMQAIKNGAVAVVSEDDLPIENLVKVENARSAYALMSKHFFEDSCDKLRMIAITGTNGKTTTASTISSLLETAGAKVANIGTLGAKYDGVVVDTKMTTPDPYQLHKFLNEVYKKGCEFVVMEASAHALFLEKLDGVNFEIGVLTNITEDHLDFFENMSNYANAKYKLFQNGRSKLGIVCDKGRLKEELSALSQTPLIFYGGRDNEITAQNVVKDIQSSEFDCNFLGEKMHIVSPLVGSYNVENSLASIAVCRCLGVDGKMIELGMKCLAPVEGRFNVISMKGQNIIIDFAHTPDGLEKVLATAREVTDGRLVVIFGCGGNRDKKKRPIMGSIASSLADEVILTSDNPRYEKPLDIIEDIRKGMNQTPLIVPNRKQAIEYAISRFKNGETIVIAGKGGEKVQSIGGKDYPYNDFDVVYNFFRNKIRQVQKQQEDIFDFEKE